VNFLVLEFQKTLELERAKNLLRDRSFGAHENNKDYPRYDMSTGEALADYWSYIPDATSHPLVILTGMSQMYSINDPVPDDKTVSEYMDDILSKKGVRVFGLAAPNLNNEEALLLLLATLSDIRTKPNTFIYGVCFDKFRNVDLRPGYQDFLRNRPEVQALWQATAKEYMHKHLIASEKMLQSLEALRIEGKGQNTLEARLHQFVGTLVPAVALQKDLNAHVQSKLYELRNWLLQIKNTTKRPVIQHRYDLNKDFLTLMLDIAQQNGVQVILYVIPLNPQAENPYIPEQYVAFKSWIETVAHDRQVPFANLEKIVPVQHWGEFLGGPDFKHFKGEGHRLTAQALIDHFGSFLQKQKAERVSLQ
jgi:hypothetical protein